MLPSEVTIATIVAGVVTLSLPLYLYGAWIIIDAEIVTWDVLMRHLSFIVPGLLLTAIPLALWMLPRLPRQFGSGIVMIHAFFGIQAYALLAVALTGIVHIFRAKRAHDLYENPDQDVPLDDLHENMGAWRWRLRIGVFGYLLCWLIAWLLGLAYVTFQYWQLFG